MIASYPYLIRRSLPLWLGLLFAATFTHCAAPDPFAEFVAAQGTEYDLLIHDGQVLDGLDPAPRRADLLIRADTIAYLGAVDTQLITVARRIDATGQYVAPGFIDTHAHGDPLQTPDFENFLAQGVTTICLGQDGGSPAFAELRPWMQRVDSVGPGVNIALFAGHGTLRRLSGVDYAPAPDAAGLARMQGLLTAALDAGCYGLSTGLEYTPGTFAGDAELLALARTVGERGGLIMSHVRNEDDGAIEASLRELLRQAEYCHVHASHLKVVYGQGAARATEILALLDSARQAAPHRVTADLYPYTASYTGVGIVFPEWAKPPHDYARVQRERRAELLDFLRQKIQDRNGPEATLFGTDPYAGRTLAQVSAAQGKPYEEVLLEIGPGGASGAYFVMDEALQTRLLQDPHVMVCSDGSPTMHHPRGYGSFAKVIEEYVLRDSLFSLGAAVRKMTSLPAATLGLDRRGSLGVGQYADLVVFDPAAVRATATFSEPHRLAAGMTAVVVNGRVAFGAGRNTPRHGRMLRKQNGKALTDFSYLAGTWQREGTARYEHWEREPSGGWRGYGYRLEQGHRDTLETLAIRHRDEETLYAATVPDQNDGATVPFRLNKAIPAYWSFENPGHDFPQKIQYEPLNDTTLLVRVLGSGDEGFSYRLIRN